MTALPLSAAEQARLDAIEAAPAAPESLRERLADELGRHQGWRGPMDDERPDVWQNRCECGEWDDGDEHPGWRKRYREHVADAAIDVLRGPSSDAERLRQTVERVTALADELVTRYPDAPPELQSILRAVAADIRATITGSPAVKP